MISNSCVSYGASRALLQVIIQVIFMLLSLLYIQNRFAMMKSFSMKLSHSIHQTVFQSIPSFNHVLCVCMYICYVCACVCALSVCVNVFVSVYVCVFVSVCVCVFVFISVCVFCVCFLYVFFCMCASLTICAC